MIRPGICIKKLKKVLISSFIWFYNYTYLNVFSKALDSVVLCNNRCAENLKCFEKTKQMFSSA